MLKIVQIRDLKPVVDIISLNILIVHVKCEFNSIVNAPVLVKFIIDSFFDNNI